MRWCRDANAALAAAGVDRTTGNARAELAKQSSRTVAGQLRAQIWVTTSGQFSLPTFKVALDTFGVDHLMFSVDYPFSKNAQ
ncbi:MAG: hypothetical protein H7Y19_09065 [Luteimonas sp.]|nr:hypothetical protein [Luteimonas sp.]